MKLLSFGKVKSQPFRVYIHTGAGEEYRPIAEIVEELNALEEEAKATDAALKAILKRIGV